jgi:hypothetical protein
MADLESYVTNRVINGHCDCMFLYNTFRWPWTRIAGLVAPRPMLFINSDNDRIFPMDANERISGRLERLYSLYRASDRVDAIVSVGGHAYRQDIREAAYRFINAHLKGDARPIGDSEIDIVSEGSNPGPYPITPEKLRVFPTDADLPRDQLNTKIDEHFVPLAKVQTPQRGEFDAWKKRLIAELKRFSFGCFPETIPPATVKSRATSRRAGGPVEYRLETEPGIECNLRLEQSPAAIGKVLLVVLNEEEGTEPDWLKSVVGEGSVVATLHPRGTGAAKWTVRNPPNYVARSHVLLGRTVDTGRVYDVIAAARFLAEQTKGDKKSTVAVAGRGSAGLIAAYAAVLFEEIEGVTLVAPHTTHMDAAAPQFLNVLRVCDVPDALGLVAPRRLTVVGGSPATFQATQAAYQAAGAGGELVFQ